MTGEIGTSGKLIVVRVGERGFLKVGDLTPSSSQTSQSQTKEGLSAYLSNSAPPLLRTQRKAGGRPSQPQPGEPAPPARPARRPSGQPVPDRSPKNALAVNAEGLPMHTSLTRPVHPPVAPVVGRRHNRRMHRPSQRRVNREPFSINGEGVLGRAVRDGLA